MKNRSSLTFVFIGISILTCILGSWQLYRLNWKNDLMDNIRNSILNPSLFSGDLNYSNLVSVKLDKIDICSDLDSILFFGKFVALSQNKRPLTSFKT